MTSILVRFTLPVALIMGVFGCERSPKTIEARAISASYEGVDMKLIGSVLSARHSEKEPEGVLHFLLDKGVDPALYAPMAEAAASYGWEIFVHGDGETRLLKDKYTLERCVVVGGVGKAGASVFAYGFERRHKGIDGGIMVAGLFDEKTEDEFKGEFSAATIVASNDGLVPPDSVKNQHRIYPSQTYFLTINGGNHAGFYPGLSFDNDGDAEYPAEEQLDTLGKIIHGRLDRFCQTRLKKIAEAERKAAHNPAQ